MEVITEKTRALEIRDAEAAKLLLKSLEVLNHIPNTRVWHRGQEITCTYELASLIEKFLKENYGK